MKNLTESLKNSLDNENWYAALFIALSLPDICGKIDNPEEKGSKKRYVAWFEKYIEPKYKYDSLQESTREDVLGVTKGQILGTLPDSQENPEILLTGSDCYALRCAFLHEGNEDISGQTAQERINSFQFITPDSYHDASMRWDFHCNMDANRNILQLQVDIFCQDILDGVKDWISAKSPTISPSLKVIDRWTDGPYVFPQDETLEMTNEEWMNYIKKTL